MLGRAGRGKVSILAATPVPAVRIEFSRPTEVFSGAYRLNVSRIDIYADFEGWELQVTDLDRFVSFGRLRRGFQENQQVHMTGPRLTDFMFGKGDVAARIYDKTLEIQRRWLTVI